MKSIIPDIWFNTTELSERNQFRKSNAKSRTVPRAAGNSWLCVSNRDKGYLSRHAIILSRNVLGVLEVVLVSFSGYEDILLTVQKMNL